MPWNRGFTHQAFLLQAFPTRPNFKIDMLDEQRIKTMLLLELLGKSIVIIILMKKNTIDLIVLNFDFYNGCDKEEIVPIRGPRLLARD